MIFHLFIRKQSDTLRCLKGVCAASLKKQNYGSFMALSKGYGLVSYAYCQCSAARVGTCSRMFAVINLALKWAIDKRTEMSEVKACTLKT